MWTFKDMLVCVVILYYACFDAVHGHVVLTFPPARKYAFDFMDNIRTPSPCGVPKGLGPLTDLKAGKKINVTWHIAYPHRGGYRISLLDARENVIQQYQNSFINANYPTILQQELTLPTTSCMNCTLRLVRQAAEWASSCDNNQYLFHSCADVNIHTDAVPDTQLCNGDMAADGVCHCSSPYSGDHCQYKDECQYDVDCNHGKCLNTESSYFPKKQCYCSSGWFGAKCNRRSPIHNITLDYSRYINTTLSPDYHLYHRIIKDLNEIEIVMRVKSRTWVGLGWRPSNLRSGCQYFPSLPGVVPGSGTTTTKPEPEPEPSTCSGQVSACFNGQCAANLMWTFHEKTDMITFKLDAEIAENEWLGLGLSKDKSMINTDIYTGWYMNGVAYIQDRYATQRREPAIDLNQNIFNVSASRVNGRTFLTFSRKRNTGDSSDEAFSDTECLYPLFAYGPVTSSADRTIGYHRFRYNGATEKLCIKSCPNPEPEPEKTTTKPEPEPEPTKCTGTVSACPPGLCNLMWTFDEKTDMITFKYDAAIEENQWLGLGFSKDKSMINTDIYTGWYTNGVAYMQDRYATAKREPAIDQTQNIFNVSASRVNGRTFLTFSRKRNTGDISDEVFSDTECLYPLFAWGPVTSSVDRTIGYHAYRYNGVTEKLCIKACPSVTPEPEKPTGEPEGEGEPGSCGAPPRGLNDITGDTPHPMDCVDMVIGSAKGQLSRIRDYYSRDRSTPQQDEFYGGTDDLTAAYGFEDSSGYTTIMFRKKIRANERSDFSFLNEYMHVIWAKGQEPGKFHHQPDVGLDDYRLSSFYKEDELKYHGHSGQRGVRRLNFLDEPSGPIVGNCAHTWRNPSDSTHEVTWQYDSTTDNVQFTLKARLAQRQWIGVGISRDTFMPNTDTIVGWVNDDGTVTITDGWASTRSLPATDAVQNIQSVRGSIDNGITTITFNRKRDTGDQNDIPFNQNDCVHLIYAKGGDYTVGTTRFGYHDSTPIISSQKFCIPCPTVTLSTPRPIGKFWVPFVLKLLGLPWQELYNDANSAEFKNLKNDMEMVLKVKFRPVNGMVTVIIQSFSPGSVNINGVVEIQSADQIQSKNEVSREVQDIVQEGRLGGYTVDSTLRSYSVGDPQPVGSVGEATTTAAPTKEDKPITSETVWIIIGVGLGGLLLVLILATGNCIRINRNNRQTRYTDEDLKRLRLMNGNAYHQSNRSSREYPQEAPAKSNSIKYIDWRRMSYNMSQSLKQLPENQYDNPSYPSDGNTLKPPTYYSGYKIETYVDNY